MTHICVGDLIIIGSDNGLSPGRRQAIIWTNAGILLIGPLGTNFNGILLEMLTFSFTKIRLKVSSAKWRPFCLGLIVLSKTMNKPTKSSPGFTLLRLYYNSCCGYVSHICSFRLDCFTDAMNKYHEVSNIGRTWVGNEIIDHSDVVGASPVGAAPTISSFSTEHLASIYCTKTTARRVEKHLNCGIWCVVHEKFCATIELMQ